jgi:hypothetical protein
MATIRTGTPDVKPDLPSHTEGVPTGHAPGAYESMAGHNRDGTSTSERSTGVNPSAAGPIDPRMPNLSPA